MAVVRHHGQKQHGKQRAYFIQFYCCSPAPKKSTRGRSQRQELTQRPWSTAYWLVQRAFLDSPEAPAQGWRLPTGLGSTQQSLIEKMHQRPAYKETLWRHFLNWASLFPNDCDLCQVNSKPTRTGFQGTQQTTTITLLPSFEYCFPIHTVSKWMYYWEQLLSRFPSLSYQFKTF